MKKYRYETLDLCGNLHVSATWITLNHPEWDVVTMTDTGISTIVVYRVEIEAEKPADVEAMRSAVRAAYARVESAPIHTGGLGDLRDALIDIADVLKPFSS